MDENLKKVYESKRDFIDAVSASIVLGNRKPFIGADFLKKRIKVSDEQARELIGQSLSVATAGKMSSGDWGNWKSARRR